MERVTSTSNTTELRMTSRNTMTHLLCHMRIPGRCLGMLLDFLHRLAKMRGGRRLQ